MSVFTNTTQNNFVNPKFKFSRYNNLKPAVDNPVSLNSLYSTLNKNSTNLMSMNKTPKKRNIKETKYNYNHSRNLVSLNSSSYKPKNKFFISSINTGRNINNSNNNSVTKNVNLPIIPKILNYTTKNPLYNSNNTNKNLETLDPIRSRNYFRNNIIKKAKNKENIDYSISLLEKTNTLKTMYKRQNRSNYFLSSKEEEEKEKFDLNCEDIIKKKQYIYNKSLNNKNNLPKHYNIIVQNIPNKNINYKEIISNSNLSDYFLQNIPSSIINYAYKEDQNKNFRNYMEDKGKSIDLFNKDINSSLFCLFDGHGGDEVSKFLQKNFPIELKNNLPSDNIENTLNKIFIDLDEKIKNTNYNNVGSTACIVYITLINNKKFLFCANVGDTKCILTKKDDVKMLSYDDKVTDENENERIKKQGGSIIDGRIEGQLLITRAFGDWELKNFGVSCIPHIKKIELSKDDKYVIIASDGVWDVNTDMEIFSMSLNCKNSKELCHSIIESSLMKGSTDNISCFVIKVN